MEAERRERLTRLWREAEPAVQAFVGATIRRFEDGEDVVQQVALTAARRFEEYDPARPFIAWALWLARSRVIDFYRKRGAEKLVFSETLLDRLADALVERQPQQSARLAALERCLDKLPERSRQVLSLRYEEGASMQAVAAAIGSTDGAVRVTLFRLRNLLADCIRSELAREQLA
jgi:RNA polymerase sigma-70 factor (ECF subfamily)